MLFYSEIKNIDKDSF